MDFSIIIDEIFSPLKPIEFNTNKKTKSIESLKKVEKLRKIR